MSKKNINVEIVPRNNESVERLLKRFTRKIKKEGIIQEVRDRRYYEKPSAKKAKVAKQRKKILDKLKRERDTI
jgi:small subunit ribosomal protein S21|tara:strand:+ start:222 stop:440 length:219 start_codon:yes stop_codon:yes gene_type:complete